MKLSEAKNQFINSWGSFASHWGINRTMAQIHALLLVNANPLSAEDVMEELSISRGNVNMNIRELINWGLVDRIIITGERKEFFNAEKDIWKVATTIMKERKKRELEPMLKLLESISQIDEGENEKDVKTFKTTIDGIKKLGTQADKTIDAVIKTEESWFWSSLVKIFK